MSSATYLKSFEIQKYSFSDSTGGSTAQPEWTHYEKRDGIYLVFESSSFSNPTAYNAIRRVRVVCGTNVLEDLDVAGLLCREMPGSTPVKREAAVVVIARSPAVAIRYFHDASGRIRRFQTRLVSSTGFEQAYETFKSFGCNVGNAGYIQKQPAKTPARREVHTPGPISTPTPALTPSQTPEAGGQENTWSRGLSTAAAPPPAGNQAAYGGSIWNRGIPVTVSHDHQEASSLQWNVSKELTASQCISGAAPNPLPPLRKPTPITRESTSTPTSLAPQPKRPAHSELEKTSKHFRSQCVSSFSRSDATSLHYFDNDTRSHHFDPPPSNPSQSILAQPFANQYPTPVPSSPLLPRQVMTPEIASTIPTPPPSVMIRSSNATPFPESYKPANHALQDLPSMVVSDYHQATTIPSTSQNQRIHAQTTTYEPQIPLRDILGSQSRIGDQIEISQPMSGRALGSIQQPRTTELLAQYSQHLSVVPPPAPSAKEKSSDTRSALVTEPIIGRFDFGSVTQEDLEKSFIELVHNDEFKDLVKRVQGSWERIGFDLR